MHRGSGALYSALLKKLLLKLSLGGVIAAAVTAFLLHHFSHEVVYQGRPLGAWAADLRSGDAQVREQALEALKNSPDSVEFLAKTISAGPSPVQRAGELIGRYIPTAIKRPFRRICDPGRQLLDKHLAAQALQQLGTNAESAIPALGKMLRDSNVLLASSAGMTLGRLGLAALPVLLPALDDPDFNVRSAACAALANLTTNAAPAVPRLCAILEHETGPIVPSAADTLFQIRTPAVEPATALLSSTNAATRRWSAYVLGRIGPDAQQSIPHLIAATRDENLQVRAMAINALGFVSLTSQAAADRLIEALDDSDATIRVVALTALLNRPSVIRRNASRISALLSDDSPIVRANAARALGHSGVQPDQAAPPQASR